MAEMRAIDGGRDPFTDPRSGDILTNGERSVEVHSVENGQVYFALWEHSCPEVLELIRVPLSAWPNLCVKERALVVDPPKEAS